MPAEVFGVVDDAFSDSVRIVTVLLKETESSKLMFSSLLELDIEFFF